ncbi:HupE/UreJ family protein [Aliikangiella maris]|uniref:HupE/UreJ family protein n=2 Tax=Aliikangiella maris TaxID=3162458 RepID=A0ABV3MTL5_9GAMM
MTTYQNKYQLSFFYSVIFTILLSTYSTTADAHLSGYTDTAIQIAKPGIQVTYTLPRDNILELPQNSFTKDTKNIILAPENYQAIISQGWSVSANRRNCHRLNIQSFQLTQVQAYQYKITYQCPQGIDNIQINYYLFINQSRGHQNYARVFMAGEEMRTRFTFDKNSLDIPVTKLLTQWDKKLSPTFINKDLNQSYNPDTSLITTAQKKPTKIDNAFTANWRWLEPGFIIMGMQHILLGLDHILFVIALLLVAMKWRQLISCITLFTLAHSITLALSYMGILKISPTITEPLIALTVLIIGFENLYILRAKTETALQRSHPFLIFIFGLIHGVGLSYQLTEYASGYPITGRLFLFNMGVEIGQLMIILVLYWPIMQLLHFKNGKNILMILSVLIAIAGGGWFIERVI